MSGSRASSEVELDLQIPALGGAWLLRTYDPIVRPESRPRVLKPDLESGIGEKPA